MPASRDPEAWGVQRGYENYKGEWCKASERTTRRLLDLMEADAPAPPRADVRVVRAGEETEIEGAVEVRTEDGGSLSLRGALPRDLPLGYHRLVDRDGRATRLIVTPGACHLPAGLETWGWAVQLYSSRSRSSWGIGDLSDLERIARWASGDGAGMVLLNPLHAGAPGVPQRASHYIPSSRSFRNPLYIAVEDVPGASAASAELDAYAEQGRALNAADRIGRDEVYRTKLAALELLWEAWSGSPSFEAYREAQGEALHHFATYMSLAEAHGADHRRWPQEFAHPGAPGVARWRADNADRIAFHQWLQWLLDEQLHRAEQQVGIVHDLAVGVDVAGADAWMWHDVFASEARIGAPPDEFSATGQDWGLPPFDPWKLRAHGYEPFVQTVRASLRHGAGVRIDHVMGLFRLWWIADDMPPTEGAYVRYPHEDLLGIVALESQRAGAYVVGEDLGTVEPLVREEMAARNILSYRVAWFEEERPASYPRLALAAATNHDLPTIAGLWSGEDLREQQELGLDPDPERADKLRRRLEDHLGLRDDASEGEVIERMYASLAQAPSMIVVATLEDALAVRRRPNLPGTTEELRPNWSLPLPVPIEELDDQPLARRIAKLLSARRPAPPAGRPPERNG